MLKQRLVGHDWPARPKEVEMWKLCLHVITLAVFALALSAADHARADDLAPPAQIKALMAGMFDRPDSKLEVDPVVVVSDHAIAGWSQGDMGGRALLRRKGRDWQLILCSGDQLKSVDNLVKMGLPADMARPLAAKLSEAESKLPSQRLALFAKFDGIVMMDQHGNHPPSHPGRHPPHQGH